MIAYKLVIEFTWGHQSRIIGLSKSNPSYYYPPPTTLLGALLEPVAKEYRLGEEPRGFRKLLSNLSHKLLAIGIRPVNAMPVKYMDLNRIIIVRKRGKITYPICSSTKDIMESFDAPARGKTILSSLDMEPPKIELLLVLQDNIIRYGNTSIELGKDLLWEIHRIGSKESLVSIINILETTNINAEEGIVSTTYSLPLDNNVKVLEEIRRKWSYEVYIDPYNINTDKSILEYYLEGRNLKTFMIPIKTSITEQPMLKIEVTKPYMAYTVKFPDDRESIIGVSPRHA